MTVIYLFVSPSGRAYAGRHTCQHEGWPRRGSGALPSGYRGSGKLWANVTRRHGPAIRWIILRRFGPDAVRAEIDAAERRAIRLARAVWGERCVNVLEGGEGFTSADARALLADPEVKAKISAASKAMWANPEAKAKTLAATAAALSRPEVKARQHRAIREALNKPEVKARQSAAQLEAQNRPEVKAKLSNALKEAHARPEVKARRKVAMAEAMARPGVMEARKEACNRPEVRARNSAAQKARAQTPERRAFLASIQASSYSPEATAKRLATRARNKARRVMEEQQ